MPAAFQPHLPAAPLMRYINERFPDMSDREVAEILGCHRGTITNLRLDKRAVTVDMADRFAAALQLHPMDIWGDGWLQVPIRQTMLGGAA